ncbi:TraY domain-containing protein [Vibrio scophthalmi]|uniref:Relaxosome protein TraY n=1 Tax=Vibrio scophthalmi TaxID=45658 RepID=A0A1E3WIW6_9VIBR|nr:TraY domain-containing protein [Vibrio scophthalmi]ODS09708.1 hypothetical protein VSF3289_03271 [Vibrio scophthalmi]
MRIISITLNSRFEIDFEYLPLNSEKKTTVSAVIDEEGNYFLSIATAKSGRSNRKESVVRLADHLERFKEDWQPVSSRTDKSQQLAQGTTVTLTLKPKLDRILNASTAKSSHSKRIEAGLRIKDHLKRFGEDWLTVGNGQ